MIGINRGPSYLSLEDFSDSPGYVRYLSVTAAVLSLGLVARVFWAAVTLPAWNETRVILLRLAFFLSTTAVLLLSASITIRQEYRWLYPAFLVFLALLASAPGIVKRGRTGVHLALAALVVVSLGREMYLVRRLPNFFAFGAYQTANNLVETLSHVTGSSRYDSILIRGDVPYKDWVFLKGTFSRFYHLPSLEFGAQTSVMGQTDAQRLVLDYNESDRSFKITNSDTASTAPFHQMDYTVLAQSPAALTPDNRWSTPTKTPVFASTKNGVNCEAVVAPVKLDLAVPQGASRLHVCFSHSTPWGMAPILKLRPRVRRESESSCHIWSLRYLTTISRFGGNTNSPCLPARRKSSCAYFPNRIRRGIGWLCAIFRLISDGMIAFVALRSRARRDEILFSAKERCDG